MNGVKHMAYPIVSWTIIKGSYFLVTDDNNKK